MKRFAAGRFPPGLKRRQDSGELWRGSLAIQVRQDSASRHCPYPRVNVSVKVVVIFKDRVMRKILLAGLVSSGLMFFTAPARAQAEFEISSAARQTIFNRFCDAYRNTNITYKELYRGIALRVALNTPASPKTASTASLIDAARATASDMDRNQKIRNNAHSITQEVIKKCH
jgi:hypothetical protein